MDTGISRRNILKIGASAMLLAPARIGFAKPASGDLPSSIRAQALAAMERHRRKLAHFDRIGIVDFTRPSSSPRLFILDTASGAVQPHLVAHGRGSDPAHTGWALRFSNEPGSLASSCGAYATRAEYFGKHGRSMRLAGLDAQNGNAESRAIVVHAADYVGPRIVTQMGKLGRSQGCFAVSDSSLDDVLAGLGAGRLLYAAKA